MVYASLGSVSSGTHRNEDLLPAFAWQLRNLVDRADEAQVTLEESVRDTLERAEAADRIRGDGLWFEELEESESFQSFMNEDIYDALNVFSPPFCSFGAHPGDGADFGFWFDHDAFESACEDGDVYKTDDLVGFDPAEHPDVEYVAVISDHGNIELYPVSVIGTGLEEAVLSVV